MGAHNMATLAAARERIAFASDGLNPASSWPATFAEILDRGHVSGSLKNWAREGMTFETFQVTIELDDGGDPTSAGRQHTLWCPGPRTMNSKRATYFTSGESDSRRDFRGMTTYAATDDYWIGFSAMGSNRVGLVLYRVVK